MSTQIRKIGITTGGGDCPGLNAVIRSAVRCAIQQYGWEVLGIEDGFDGLIWTHRTLPLTLDTVSDILDRGGTILGTTNRGNPFSYCVKKDDGTEEIHDLSDRVIENARELGLDAVIVIGGDGTQAIGLKLAAKGLNVVGVPKTIDNDLSATEVTFGFDSALHVVTDAIDRLRTTAESHHRIMVIEVMGRDAGWIALEAGIAGGAHVILIPEIPFSIEKVCEFVRERQRQHKRFTVVVVAEGIKIPPEVRDMFEREQREFPHAGYVSTVIGEALGLCSKREVRVVVLGHTQRGGTPSPFDRILSTRFGVAAVDLVANGHFGKMVCLREGCIKAVDIREAVGAQKLVKPDSDLVRTARATGVIFGD
jgi:6-phosphofructokinase 1